jgi:raffinose/stachyose/melibiose transport system permease protein
VLSTPSHFTLPLAVAMFQSQYSTDTARVFAYTALSMLPALSISSSRSATSSVA